MSFPDITAELRARMPKLRGRLMANQSLAELTWFRVGGPAQVLFMPEDEADLAYALAELSADIEVTVIGLGSNLIVRDGGVAGVVIRLGRGFSDILAEEGAHVRAGAGVPDVKVARAAQEAAIAGLAFFRGIPGAIGGALRMNGGAYGHETCDALIEARGVDRAGRLRVFTNADMHYEYRHCGAPDDIIFTQALFHGAPGDQQQSRPRWTRSRSRARRRSRSRAAPAARPSRTHPAARPGSSLTPPAAAGSWSAARRSRRCTAIS
jgi:UDP-N-acetylmuramate dehydrogenase